MFVIRYYKFFYILSALLILGSIGVFWVYGVKPSIEFTGGSLLKIQYETDPPSADVLRQRLKQDDLKSIANLKNASVQGISKDTFLLRFAEVDEKDHQAILTALEGAKELQFQSIGPVIGSELKRKAITGLVLAVLGMFFYVGIAFRKISGKIRSWKMSIAAIAALIHDVLIAAGGFAIFSYVYGFEFGTLFIAAELTVWGYSINDTIVVFDRIRENLLKSLKKDIMEIAGMSINQTLTRSINTSFAVLILLLVLYLFGPSPLFPFVTPLIIGVVAGTYSSICIATPLLLEGIRRKS